MYEVNINAKPEQFLDWDRPLKNMSPEDQKALNDAWLAHPESHAGQYGADIYRAAQDNAAFKSGRVGSGSSPAAFKPFEAQASEVLRDAGIPGIRYLDQGSRQPKVLYGGNPIPRGNIAAELAAEKLGLHGATDAAIASLERDAASGHPYIRQNSAEAADLLRSGQVARHEPQGTSNYVLFNDKIIDILRKYGLAGGMAGAGAAAAGNDQAQAQPFGSLSP